MMKITVFIFFFPCLVFPHSASGGEGLGIPEKDQQSLKTGADVARNSNQESEIFQTGDICVEDLAFCLEKIENLGKQYPLSLLSLNYLRDLSEKVLLEKLPPQHQQGFLKVYCKTTSLLRDGTKKYNCPQKSINLLSAKAKFSEMKKIIIESIPLSFNEFISLDPDIAYHWTLQSDSEKTLSFYGSFTDLLNQDPAAQEIGPIEAPLKKRLWLREHNWLYMIGIVAIAGLSYSLKDKNLVIQTSP